MATQPWRSRYLPLPLVCRPPGLYSWPPRSHWSRAVIALRPVGSWGETKEKCEPLEVPTWEKQKNDKDHSETLPLSSSPEEKNR